MTSADDDSTGCPPHDHVLRLVAVHLEDGYATRELACDSCGAVWFS